MIREPIQGLRFLPFQQFLKRHLHIDFSQLRETVFRGEGPVVRKMLLLISVCSVVNLAARRALYGGVSFVNLEPTQLFGHPYWGHHPN